MKTIAICDDNKLQRELLADMLKTYFGSIHQNIKIVEYDCGETLIADVEEEDLYVELLFLDICMAGINGIDTAKKLRNLNCDTEIIFLTATADYALESYEVQAAGYLVKPIDMSELSSLLKYVWGGASRENRN